ncbi:MAG TPA: ABC transporter ATP-binding protein [Candidatus Acutalibacter stercorigallinarum]|nr:ABC transporter ATP-binding protein [Candidatus Acutalibacter stercorigallinarum]
MDAIVTYDLAKQYGGTWALRGLNLQVPQGSAVACVGRENSGKTTLIRLLSGLYRPTSGECTVLGLSPAFETERLHALVGTVLGTARLYGHLTLQENLNFFAGLHQVDSNDGVERSSFLLHALDIWEARDLKVRELPTGVLRRAALAQALMHRPSVLLLDLPPQGLDPESQEATHRLLAQTMEQEGTTLLLCTRNMAYAQAVCSGFALLQDGVLLGKGDLESLRRAAGLRFRAALRLKEGDPAPAGFRLGEEGLWIREIASEEEMPQLIAQAVQGGGSLFEARVIRPTLAEIYEAYADGRPRKAGEQHEQDGEADVPGPQAPAAPGAESAPAAQDEAQV